MLRNRTTVKVRPGLFLQPFIVSQLSARVIGEVVAGSEVTAQEFAVTSWLAVVGGATPTEVSNHLGIAPTTLSAMIERLVRKQQVRRVRHPGDGRSYVLELTAAGQKTNARVRRRFLRAVEDLDARLEVDSEEILEALRRLEAGLRALLDS